MSWIVSLSLSLVAGVLLAAAATYVVAGRREQATVADHPPVGRFVEVDGLRVHYVEAGSGPPIVLLHGASGNLQDFTFDLLPRLAATYRVIAFDRPGLGRSDPLTPVRAWGARGARPRAQATHLAKAAAALGMRNPVVLGHSFGGIVALAWGLEHDPAALVLLAGVANPWPGRVGRLHIVNGSRPGGALAVPAITAWTTDAAIRNAYAGTFAPQDMPQGYADHMGLRMPLRRAVFRENARQVNGLKPEVLSMHEEYDRLTLPIELVHGDADATVPLAIHSEPLSRRLASANLVVLPGVGHMPHHADPDAAVAAVDRAMRRAGLI